MNLFGDARWCRGSLSPRQMTGSSQMSCFRSIVLQQEQRHRTSLTSLTATGVKRKLSRLSANPIMLLPRARRLWSKNRPNLSDSPTQPESLTHPTWVTDRNTHPTWVTDRNTHPTWVTDRNTRQTWVTDRNIHQTWVPIA